MDKLRESKLFEYVYGHCKDWSVRTCESPDFICIRNNIPILGVEVTELYHNETDARLKNLDGYVYSIANGGDFRHKQDKKNVKVDNVKAIKVGNKEIIKKDENDGLTIKAIIQEVPILSQRPSILGKTIESKEKKVVSYLQVCPEIDLIIDDASNLFCFDQYEGLFYLLSRSLNKPTIVNSRFREIFLITTNRNMITRIPLKLNLFVEDAKIFMYLILKNVSENQPISVEDSFLILLCCLYQSGYKNISIKNIDGKIGLIVGSHLYLHLKEKDIIQDYTTIPERISKGELISEIVNTANEAQRQIANTLLKERSHFKCCDNLFFEVQSIIHSNR